MPPPVYNDFHTWNPILHFDVVDGPFPAEFLRDRTIRLTIIDNAKKYDRIEWVLDNRDGALTKPEYMALGLLVRIRYGYQGFTSDWRSFVISRMKGGVGVAGRDRAAVDAGSREITYTGRNRNAPDLRKRRRRARRGMLKPTGTGRNSIGPRRGRSTSDVMQTEGWFRKDPLYSDPADYPQVFSVSHLSDAVREMARRMGYTTRSMRIEPTDDQLSSVVIPAGLSYDDFLYQKADELGWTYKGKSKTFHFHSDRWSQEKKTIKHVFHYGMSNQVLSLRLDGDFRLPLPRVVKSKTYVPRVRTALIHQEGDGTSAPVNAAIMLMFREAAGRRRIRAPQGATRKAVLEASEEVFTAPGGATQQASKKASKRFVDRQLRALKVQLQVVGDPTIEAAETIQIRGTGTLVVDGPWHVSTVKHIFSGDTYVCDMDLRAPPKLRGARRIQTALFYDPKNPRTAATVAFRGTTTIPEFKNLLRGKQ